jgi:hypothetical protein
MVESVQPYQFEPLTAPEELEAIREWITNQREGHSEGEEEEGDDDIRWCECDCCEAMLMAKESICCKEIWEATTKMGQAACITFASVAWKSMPGF